MEVDDDKISGEAPSDNLEMESTSDEGCQFSGSSSQTLDNSADANWRGVDKSIATVAIKKDPYIADISSVDEGFELVSMDRRDSASGDIHCGVTDNTIADDKCGDNGGKIGFVPSGNHTEPLKPQQCETEIKQEGFNNAKCTDNSSKTESDSLTQLQQPPHERDLSDEDVCENAASNSTESRAEGSSVASSQSAGSAADRASVRKRPSFRTSCAGCGSVDASLTAAAAQDERQQLLMYCARCRPADPEHHMVTRKSAVRRTHKQQKRVFASRSSAPKTRGRRAIFKKTCFRSPSAFATPITCDHVFHKGIYYQVGDIVCLRAAPPPATNDATRGAARRYYAQIRCLLQDEYCEKSAVITWLLPTVAATQQKQNGADEEVFEPHTYVLGPDEQLPRRLDVMAFVCHAPADYYYGGASYGAGILYPSPVRQYRHGFCLDRMSAVPVSLFDKQTTERNQSS